MSQFHPHQLITSLQQDVEGTILFTRQVLNDSAYLNTPPQPGKWTIAQIIEHLNTYNNYYLPAIEKAFAVHERSNVSIFKTGLLGGYITRMMQPNAHGKVANKTKAFKKHIPVVELNAEHVLQDFVKGQERFLLLLDEARNYNLNSVRIKMSISPLIKLKLGDILRVLVVHQLRHFIQIREAQQLINAGLQPQIG